MSEWTHRLKVGDIECIAINDGNFILEKVGQLQGIFPDAPADELEQVFDSLLERERLWCFNTLHIKAGDQQILIDTGYGVASKEHGHTTRLLADEGISPSDITIVFITHAHGDHINGLSDADGALAFPNARYVMGKKEWDFWMGYESSGGFDAGYLSGVRGQLELMQDNLTLVEPGDSIVPGITTIDAYGHTPGHMILMIESQGERMLHMVDAAHAMVQMSRPDWSPRFDVQPDISPAARRKIYQRAADEKLLVFSYHLPFPALGYITVEGDGFRWQPME